MGKKLLALLLLCSCAWAEEDDSLFSLEITVTATKTPRRAFDTPASVSIITREAISAAPAHNVDDLLVSAKGVVLKRSIGMGEGVPADINMRGIPAAIAASRTLILVDGIPTNVSGTPLLILNEVPLEAVERVEIVRGPYSCLYGANAFGGVINIITRTPKDSMRTEVYGDLGNMVYWQGAVWNGAGAGKLSYSVNAGLRGIGNYFGRDSALIRREDGDHYIKTENFNYGDRRFFGKTEYALRPDLTARLHLRYFESELGFGLTRKTPTPEAIITKGNKFLAGPFLEWKPSPALNLTGGVFYRRTKGEFWNEAILEKSGPAGGVWTASMWEAVSDDIQGQAQASFWLGYHHLLSVGGDGLFNQIHFGATEDRNTGAPVEGSRPVDKDLYNGGVFVQDEMSYWDRLLVVPGVRFDYSSGFKWAVSPKIGAQVRVAEPLRLRASFGRGFRAPSTSELYLPEFTVNFSTALMSNPDLTPEYLWAADGGGVLTLFEERVVVQSDFFYNRMKDLIAPRFYGIMADGFKVTFKNISQAVSYGLESGVDLKVIQPLFVFCNYTFTESEEAESGGALDYIPLHKANAGFRVNFPLGRYLLEASFAEDYTGSRSYLDWGKWENIILNDLDKARPVRYYLEPYWRTDIGLKGSYKDRVWAGISAQNVFNATFEESGGNLAPGRLISLRLGAGF